MAAPIILHLVMRQQPKHLVFPALQFHPAAQFVESTEVEIAAFDFAGPALRGHRFFGLGLGAPEFAGHRLVGRSGSTDRGSHCIRHVAANAVSASKSNPSGSGAGSGPARAGATAAGKRCGGARFANAGSRVFCRCRRGQAKNRSAGDHRRRPAVAGVVQPGLAVSERKQSRPQGSLRVHRFRSASLVCGSGCQAARKTGR